MAGMKEVFLAKRARLGKTINDFLQLAELDISTGKSEWVDITKGEITKRLGNGDSFSRQGSSLRKYFIVRSRYANGIDRIDDPGRSPYYERNGSHVSVAKGDKKVALRLDGYASVDVTKPSVPKGMAKLMLEAGIPESCAWSGSRSALEVDHCEGRPQKDGWTTEADPHLYQFLTEHNNKVKRNACASCVETGRRFNARERLGTRLDFLEGGEKFEIDGPGCKGCMLYDIRLFFSSL